MVGPPGTGKSMLAKRLPTGRLHLTDEAAKVALISPDATLSIIRDFEVVEKLDLKPPVAFKGLIRCPNPACIVHDERVPGSFVVEQHQPMTVRCEYCERTITADQFEFA